MARTLVAHEQPIVKIFSEDYVFTIPDYQRPYSWTTEQARELIEDLTGFMEANRKDSIGEMPTYFLGSIVLIKGDDSRAAVVDGQQRLTTLTILLSVIRANTEEKLRPQITKRLYEEGDPFAGTVDRFRLTLRNRDSEFFQKYVQREGGVEQLIKLESDIHDSRLYMRDNARLFQKRIEAMSERGRLELTQFILQRCFLVTVATPDENSAYRIFSVLNSRGLDLSATDILKARIIGKIDDANERTAYTAKWEDAEEDLGRDEFNNLFGHIRTVYRKAKAKETLLKEFEECVPEVKIPKTFVDDVLLPMGQAFSEVTSASYAASTRADDVNEALRWLNRLEFNDWIPPALAFTARNRDMPERMAKFMQELERLAYFMLVTGRGVNERIERFAKVTDEVEKGRDLFGEDSSLQLTKIEKHEFYTALDGPFYDSLSAKARTPVMLRLDRLLSDGSASYDFPVISVEHVLPQNPRPGSNWLALFPDAKERIALVHRLGNLALLSRRKNSQASNWDFDRKKTSYFARGSISPFVLTTQVLNVPIWNSQSILDRQKSLMDKLEAHWRLQDRVSLDEWLLRDVT